MSSEPHTQGIKTIHTRRDKIMDNLIFPHKIFYSSAARVCSQVTKWVESVFSFVFQWCMHRINPFYFLGDIKFLRWVTLHMHTHSLGFSQPFWDFLCCGVFIGMSFPAGSASKKICLQCRRPGFNSWVGRIPWRKEQLPTPVFWPGEFHGQNSHSCTYFGKEVKQCLGSFLPSNLNERGEWEKS